MSRKLDNVLVWLGCKCDPMSRTPVVDRKAREQSVFIFFLGMFFGAGMMGLLLLLTGCCWGEAANWRGRGGRAGVGGLICAATRARR